MTKIELEKLLGGGQLPEDLDSPDWASGGKCYNWKNHVPTCAKSIWESLPIGIKIGIFVVADDVADNEEWI